MSDNKKVALGIDYNTKLDKNPEISATLPANHGGYCVICYEELADAAIGEFSLKCNHTFCRPDWLEYLSGEVNKGADGIVANCMQTGCNVKVGHSAFLTILHEKPDDIQTYWKWLAKSYTDDNQWVKMCPELPWCGHYHERDRTSSRQYVTCRCGFSFCFLCEQPSHRPCDCELTKKWEQKNESESENITWLKANTRSCPVCNTPTQKNGGCDHMTCRTCERKNGKPTHWCWICNDHGTAVGNYSHTCKKYDDLTAERNNAQSEIARYTHFFDRFNNHDKSAKYAKAQHPKLLVYQQRLHEEKCYEATEVKFLTEANNTVIEARNVLKWTNPFAFYLEKEFPPEIKNFFREFWQNDLEQYVNRLTEFVEADLEQHLKADTDK